MQWLAWKATSTTGTIEYFGYGQDGRLLQDWSNRRNVRNGYIYLGNTLVGLYEVTLSTGAVASRYKHTDALGSPVATTDAAKAVLSRTSYTPYGVPTLPVDGVGYTGHFIDVNTSLTYMQQRYYDPQIGRFLSTDPVSTDANNGSSFNRYKYASNNPFFFTDPDGRKDAADRFSDAVALEARKHSHVFDSHEKPAIFVTGLMLVGPAAVAVIPEEVSLKLFFAAVLSLGGQTVEDGVVTWAPESQLLEDMEAADEIESEVAAPKPPAPPGPPKPPAPTPPKPQAPSPPKPKLPSEPTPHPPSKKPPAIDPQS